MWNYLATTPPSLFLYEFLHFTEQHTPFSSDRKKMTESETNSHGEREEENGNTLGKIISEVDDTSHHSFKDHDDHDTQTPAVVVVVWRNVILMSLLHMSALYGIFLIPSASVPTLIFCKYELNDEACFAFQYFVVSFLMEHNQRGLRSKVTVGPEGA